MSLIFNEFEEAVKYYNEKTNNEYYGYQQIALLVKYCNYLEIPTKEIKYHLYQKFPKLNLQLTDRAIKNVKNSTPNIPQSIFIYKEELDMINHIESKSHQKVLFMLLCLVKLKGHGNGIYIKSGTDISWNKIFKMCLLPKTETSKKQQYTFLKCMGNTEIRKLEMPTQNVVVVPFKVDEGEIVLEFKPSENMILEFERVIGEKIISCQRCGKLVRQKMNNHKYCEECGVAVNREITRAAYTKKN